MGATSFTIDQEIQTRYETAFNTLACRALGEPYNFHRVAPLLVPGMLKTDLRAASILATCLKQFGKNSSYTPQSIALDCKMQNSDAIEMSGKDAEMSLPDAMEAFLLYYGQWAEVRISELTKAYILRGLTTEEIQVEQSKERKAMGLTTRLNSSDGKEEFEAELLAAIDGKPVVYPVRPYLSGMRAFAQYYQPGDYIIKVALSGVGKSYDALGEAYYNAINGVPVCIINLEITPKDVQKRLWQKHSGIYLKRNIAIDESDAIKAIRAWEDVKALPISVHKPNRSLVAVLNTIRQDVMEKGSHLAIVDYVQLMNIPGNNRNRNYELGEISAELRSLANDLNIVVIAYAQMKQEVDKKPGKRGGMYDVKDSADFTQDATMVQVIYRPEALDVQNDQDGSPYPEGYADFFIAKGREVGMGFVEARFDKVNGFHDKENFQSTSTQFPASQPFTVGRADIGGDIPF